MTTEQVRCTACGRSFGSHYQGPKGRCMYCGGALEGPGQSPDDTEERPVPERAIRPSPLPPRLPRPPEKPIPLPLPASSGPSRWERPISVLHELSVLLMLSLGCAAALALLHRNDPLLPPLVIGAAGVLLAAPLLVGSLALRAALALFSGPAASTLLAVPLLAVGLLLGLPGQLARGLARAQAQLFGPIGLCLVLAVFAVSIGWLDKRHDPLQFAMHRLEQSRDDARRFQGYRPLPSGWSGSLRGSEQAAAFSLRILEVHEQTFTAGLTWIRSGRVDQLEGAWLDNHLIIPYPGPPGEQAFWMRPGMLSSLDLWVLDGNRLEGADPIFSRAFDGRRAWVREAPADAAQAAPTVGSELEVERPPLLDTTVVLRPRVAVDLQQITQGRAFALRFGDQGEPLVITAASLFGPAGGLDRSIIPQMLPALVGEALLYDLATGAMRARGQLRLPPAGCRPLSTEDDAPPDASGDVLAFSLQPGHSVQALRLRDEPVDSDLTLWLPTRGTSPGQGGELLVAGSVLASWDEGFSLRFAGAITPAEHVGAPLLDRHGRVAGMLVGGGQAPGTQRTAFAIPAHWIARRLGR